MVVENELTTELLMSLYSGDGFPDWDTFAEDNAHENHISEHPEVWENIELPERLAEINEDTSIGIYQHVDLFNLKAIAFGLGLETIEYHPETFNGLVYFPSETEAAVILWGSGLILSIADSSKDSTQSIELVLERINEVGLLYQSDGQELTGDEFNAIRTMTVSEVIQEQPDSPERRRLT